MTTTTAWDIRSQLDSQTLSKTPQRNILCVNSHAQLFGDVTFDALFTSPFSKLAVQARQNLPEAAESLKTGQTEVENAIATLTSELGDTTLQGLLSRPAGAFTKKQIEAVRAARKAGLMLPMPSSDAQVQSARAQAVASLLRDAPKGTLKQMFSANQTGSSSSAATNAVREAQQTGALPNKPPVNPPTAPITLANCQVSFHTNDEDKDDDTFVIVSVYDVNNTLCATIANDFGHFNDHSDEGPFALLIRNPSTSDALSRGSVIIHIDPNGHDTWRFNFTLDLHFSDNSHLGGSAYDLELTQDRQQQSFGIDGLISN